MFAFLQHLAGHLSAFKQGRKLLLSSARGGKTSSTPGAAGCLGQAPEGWPWHSQGLGGHLAKQEV